MVELSAGTLRHQAEAFLDFEARANLPREIAWTRWARSKDFSPAQLDALHREVLRARRRRCSTLYLRTLAS